MNWLRRLFGNAPVQSGSLTQRVTIKNPLIIDNPRIGLFNLMGSSSEAILKEDKEALGPLFSAILQSNREPPICNVLMIYGHLENNGRFEGQSDGLRDIIRKSTAQIVIIASENDGDSYIVAGKGTGYGQANLIMTLGRKGSVFTSFFSQLFGKMFNGQSMLLAWVELAPQIPGAKHDNCPETIFAAEISHVIFRHTQLNDAADVNTERPSG